ncbi:DegV domain-containing protein MG450 [Frankliniella fusca]|uniref:DegV domain-containing protein MG450 n=1 Tax=Frankliniella fusca TaxID=407009 RepID=A0AAE1HCN8_9NEOP|nr:DegV domain-containing protein MG450 [Frankliniella fusca]
MATFEKLCQQLESKDECQFTMADLVAMMPEEETYSEKYLGMLLKDKYKDRVVIVERPDPSTIIFTCLLFAAEQGQKFFSVTFDQPLYWKATEIVLASPANSQLRNIIVRLCGFHLLLSFMGSIGHLMSGSGLEDP